MQTVDKHEISTLLSKRDPKPSHVAKTCMVVDRIIDQQRSLSRFVHSYGMKFIEKIFEATHSSDAWMQIVTRSSTNKAEDTLFNILAPEGTFFRALENVGDGQSFSFPIQNLPNYTQRLWNSRLGRKVLATWPQYNGRIDDRSAHSYIELPAFVYYLFWFAKFPTQMKSTDKRSPSAAGEIYFRLLRKYLEYLLPRNRHRASHPGYLLIGEHQLPDRYNIGELFLSILVEFWLTDDEEALPEGCPDNGREPEMEGFYTREVAQMRRQKRPELPSQDVLEGLAILFEYINTDCNSLSYPVPALHRYRWLPLIKLQTYPRPRGRLLTPVELNYIDSEVGSLAAQAMFRRLYRFIRRSLRFWQEDSMSSLTPILRLWIVQMCPWKPPKKQAPRKGALNVITSTLQKFSPGEDRDPDTREESPWGLWNHHVCASLPFYLVLIPAFIYLTAKRMPYCPDRATKDLIQVLSIFDHTPELKAMLESIEQAVLSFLESKETVLQGEYSHLVTFVVAQAEDWDLAAKSGSPRWTPQVEKGDFLLFADKARDVPLCLKDILVQAHGRVKSRYWDQLSSLIYSIFGIEMPVDFPTPNRRLAARPPPSGVQWNTLDKFYHSDFFDPLHQPISSIEIAFLANFLVTLSHKVNEKWKLPASHCPEETCSDANDENFGANTRERGEIDIRWGSMVQGQLAVWIGVCMSWSMHWMNNVVVPMVKQKWPDFRVNLRPLANRRVVNWFVFFCFIFLWPGSSLSLNYILTMTVTMLYVGFLA